MGCGGTAGVCGVGLGWLDGVDAGRRCVGGLGTAVGTTGDTAGVVGNAGGATWGAVRAVSGTGPPVVVGSGPAVGSALAVGSVPNDGLGTWAEAERVAVGSVGGVVGGMGSPVGAGAGEGCGVGVGVGVTVGGGGRVGTRGGGRWTASGSDRSEAAGTIGAGAGGGRPGPGSSGCGAAAVPGGVEGAVAGWPVAGTITGPTERVGMNGVLLSGSAVLPTVADPVLMAARIGMEAVPASRATVKRYPRPGAPEPGARCAPTTRR
ncbi:hypothetical protein GA0070558_119141 [Micromonospora haikouensis]|uniref:Uncharacterized protein n=1 Tax=Micromonospora haikouensis TaxID=686309 RepID=A0A1C4WYL8_9ACTN|nr:hypothetical protein GA0070558_119141 [Micromonospora haikouensis]